MATDGTIRPESTEQWRANIAPHARAKVSGRFTAPVAVSTVDGSPARPVAATGPGGRCPGCGYVYDEAVGAPREGFPAGTPWSAVPDSWCCPDCGVREKIDFLPPGPVHA